MDTQPYKILLIESNLEVANTIINWISDKIEVTHAAEASQAKKLVAQDNWDVVITDINSPDFNDLDITVIVKKVNPTTAVLIVTEDKKVDFIITAMQNHADGLLFKPLNKKEFITKVMQLAEEGAAKRHKERKVILAIGAHPDDVEYGCGGTLAKYRSEGSSINILTLSLGEVGGDSVVRKEEAKRAAEMQGANLYLGNLIDTEITNSIKTIKFIEHVVEQVNPTHIYTHSFHDNHQDHRNIYQASVIACRHIANFFCYLSPSTTVNFKPNVFINIDQFLEAKLKTIEIFSSQSNIRPYLQPEVIEATARYWGRYCNYHLAEPMEVIKVQSS